MKKEVIRKIRIAHITGWLHVGGKEKGMVNLVNSMPSDIFENHIYVFVGGGIMRQRIDPKQCQVEELGNKLGNDIRLYFKLAALLRRHRIHIVHTRSWFTLLEGMIPAKIVGVPIIVHSEHGIIKADTKLHVWIQRYLWKKVDQVLSVSEVLQEDLVRMIGFPKDNIKVIKNGIDLHNFDLPSDDHEFRKSFDIPDDTLLFGSIVRLVEKKDNATLIRAAKIVFEFLPKSMLILVGDGPLYEELTALANELGIAGKVRFLKWQKDIPRIMQALDLFVLSPTSDGMPNSILEAMASRKAVVATNVGGNPELVVDGETGLLVPPKDPQKMGQAIISLLLDPQRRLEMGQAGRRRVEEQFPLSGMIHNYEKVYLELASKRFIFHPELQEKIDQHFAQQKSLAVPSLSI